MLLFVMFLVVDLVTIGIFYAVYGGKRKYSEGMLLGVHIPESAAKSEEIQNFMKAYKRKTNWFYLVNAVAGALVCGLCFWYFSVFMIVWCVWLLEMCIGAVALVYRTHRKLYDLKMERGWIGSAGSRIMAGVDTNTVSGSGRSGVPAWWHLIFCALILLPYLAPGVRAYLGSSEDGWILLCTALTVTLLFGFLHMVFLRVKDKVYSEDPALNRSVNRMQKRVESWVMTGCSLSNALAYLIVAYHMDTEGWLGAAVYAVYIVLETLPVVFLLAGFFYIRYRKEQFLAHNEAPLYIDDDVYWKNGWYSNPHDKRLIVQDWVCSWNYTTNMAKPAGKIFLAAGIVVTGAVLILACVLMWRIDFTPINLEAEEAKVSVTSGYSDVELGYDEILGVELLDRLPEDEYKRTNGGDDGRVLLGKFKGKETGKCRMYLYVGYAPILEISTPDGPVYVNSRTQGEAAEWKQEIEKYRKEFEAE
ncbi:hypothetical protein [Clostridium sp. Marseille-P3244]|uniref:hypothetical protein n=1 Tax=Clostridium sp. Marseille-P3244 TaxID=1871020 RepID=UPI00093173D2|nr:hypothetical protein [Clostridium sp. Marseille-P3244]